MKKAGWLYYGLIILGICSVLFLAAGVLFCQENKKSEDVNISTPPEASSSSPNELAGKMQKIETELILSGPVPLLEKS